VVPLPVLFVPEVVKQELPDVWAVGAGVDGAQVARESQLEVVILPGILLQAFDLEPYPRSTPCRTGD
jgi:hypothetical protein